MAGRSRACVGEPDEQVAAYEGATEQEARERYQADARVAASRGYMPVEERWSGSTLEVKYRRGPRDHIQGWAQALGEQSAKRLEPIRRELAGLTQNWAAPIVIREYEATDKGQARFENEAAVFAEQGYGAFAQSEEGGHIHAGRLLLTGGLSILAGRRGIRSRGKIHVTFQRSPAHNVPPPPAADVTDHCGS